MIFESIKGYVEENMATIAATDETWFFNIMFNFMRLTMS